MTNRGKALMLTMLIAASLVCTTGMKSQTIADINIETVVLSRGNAVPIAENIELTTYRNIAVSGQLKAVDTENGNISFEVTKMPKYGVLEINDSGEFKYDPKNTKHTKDTFSYVAIDSLEKRSNEATVTINIKKQKSDVMYTDMENNPALYAAVYLAENEIYKGKCVGAEYFFQPDEKVTEGEFLNMCLKASQHEILSDIVKTGLSNDAELPTWVKNTVSTAVMCGCFTGESNFEYDGYITYEDAAEMINAVFDITDVATVSAISQYYRQDSAQAVNNLYFCGIVDENIVAKYDTEVTMADAAIMLEKANQIIKNR